MTLFPETIHTYRTTPTGWDATTGVYGWGSLPDLDADPNALTEITATVLPLSGRDVEVLPQGYKDAYGKKLIVALDVDLQTAKHKRHPGNFSGQTGPIAPDMVEKPPDLVFIDGDIFVVQRVTVYRSAAPIPSREVIVLRAGDTEWLEILSPVTP